MLENPEEAGAFGLESRGTLRLAGCLWGWSEGLVKHMKEADFIFK